MKDETVKRSIFKQTTYSNVYYYDKYNEKIAKREGDKELKTETICDCNLDLPLLEKNCRFYIEEKDTVVIIESVLRTSKDNVLYIVKSNSIDGTEEEMEKSYKEAEIQRDKYVEEKRLSNEKYNYERYTKENFWFRLFHDYKDYDWIKR